MRPNKPMMSNLKADKLPGYNCPMCGQPITSIKLGGSWLERDWRCGFWYRAQCVPCSIDFHLAVRKGSVGTWQMLAPAKESLKDRITEPELDRLNSKLLRYQALGRSWQSFLSKRHPGDEFWRYYGEDGETAIAIVRKGMPVAFFLLVTV